MAAIASGGGLTTFILLLLIILTIWAESVVNFLDTPYRNDCVWIEEYKVILLGALPTLKLISRPTQTSAESATAED